MTRPDETAATDFAFQLRRLDRKAVLEVTGDVDPATADPFEEALQQAVHAGPDGVVVRRRRRWGRRSSGARATSAPTPDARRSGWAPAPSHRSADRVRRYPPRGVAMLGRAARR